MTRAKKVILLTAGILVVIAILFPPYWAPRIDENGEIYGKYTRWKFNHSLSDQFKYPIMTERGMEISDYFSWVLLRDDLLVLEILGIFAAAAAAFVIAKKKNANYKGDPK